MPLIPKQIPSYFTDHAVTLAFPARSLCVRTPLIISLSLFPVCHHQPPARPWPSRPVQLTKMLLAVTVKLWSSKIIWPFIISWEYKPLIGQFIISWSPMIGWSLCWTYARSRPHYPYYSSRRGSKQRRSYYFSRITATDNLPIAAITWTKSYIFL